MRLRNEINKSKELVILDVNYSTSVNSVTKAKRNISQISIIEELNMF